MHVTAKLVLTSLVVYIVVSMYGIWTFTAEADYTKADAALVLGTRLDGEEPSYALRERIDHAIWLYEYELVERIVFTGGLTEGGLISEAEASKLYALSVGVPEDVIVVEDRSLVTRENMLFTKELAEELNLSDFLLVSDPFHMKRALMMADVFGLEVMAAPTPQSVYTSWGEQFPFVLRETLAYVGNQLTFNKSF
ncbi:YdcF family protein [Chryseomicrobium aureum]|uniref:YdcF family protein n=1 Tax=Chryseomicrobium aureum TaxID=1441723 RepID=UPI00370DDB54